MTRRWWQEARGLHYRQ